MQGPRTLGKLQTARPVGLMHVDLHSSSVSKRFKFPPHPPYLGVRSKFIKLIL